MKKSQEQKELESRATVRSQTIHKGKIFTLRRDTVVFDSHPPHDWDIIEHPGAVALIPVKDNGDLVLIQQWRRAINDIIFELPAGTLDNGESPLSCAMREIQEEVGYKAETFIPLGGFYSAPGFCTEYIHLFVAKDLSKSFLPQDDHEAIDVVELPLNEALKLIKEKKIQDAKTISGLLLYNLLLDE